MASWYVIILRTGIRRCCLYLTIYGTERERLHRNKERKRRLEEAKHELEVAQRKGDFEAASRLRYATIPELEREIPAKGNGESAMLSERVTSDDIARVVARATGIPVQSLLKGERERLVYVGPPAGRKWQKVLTIF